MTALEEIKPRIAKLSAQELDELREMIDDMTGIDDPLAGLDPVQRQAKIASIIESLKSDEAYMTRMRDSFDVSKRGAMVSIRDLG